MWTYAGSYSRRRIIIRESVHQGNYEGLMEFNHLVKSFSRLNMLTGVKVKNQCINEIWGYFIINKRLILLTRATSWVSANLVRWANNNKYSLVPWLIFIWVLKGGCHSKRILSITQGKLFPFVSTEQLNQCQVGWCPIAYKHSDLEIIQGKDLKTPENTL